MLPLLYVALGGAFGSVCRYLAGVGIGRLGGAGGFPLATMLINITGSFLMGAWIGTMASALPDKSKEWHLLVAVGMLGGYTTFSTFSLEAYMLIEKGLWMQAAGYIAGSVILSIVALFAGLWLLRSVGI